MRLGAISALLVGAVGSCFAQTSVDEARVRFAPELVKWEAAIAAHPDNWIALGSAADAAYEIGNREKAAYYANEILRLIPQSRRSPSFRSFGGDAVYYSHWVLGLLALEQGYVEVARQELLASGGTPGSPVLNTFGPNMRLAFELLTRLDTDQNDRDTVIEFLHECAVFNPRLPIAEWETDICEGRVPDFGRMLYR